MLARLGSRTMSALAGCALLAGCGGGVYDDIDIDFDLEVTTPNDLHQPYVKGASVDFSLSGDDVADRWTSDDERIFAFPGGVNAANSGVATGDGTTTIHAFRGGDEIAVADVTVREPDGVALFAHGPLIVNSQAIQALSLSDVQVLAGGTATFLVRYYAGDEALFGNGVLELGADDGVETKRTDTFLLEKREWLQVTPSAVGPHVVTIAAGGKALRELRIEAVPEDAVHDIELYSTGEDDADDGSQVTVLAQPFDASHRPVYGVDFDWDVDGKQETGEGDLYRYEYDRDTDVHLTARRGAVRSSIDIHSQGGYVDSTNHLGCAASRGETRETAPVVVFAALALLGWRRRRGSGSTK